MSRERATRPYDLHRQLRLNAAIDHPTAPRMGLPTIVVTALDGD